MSLMRLQITDNHRGKAIADCWANNEQLFSEEDLTAVKNNIEQISNKKIQDLVSENNKLLVFPLKLNQHSDKIGEDRILSLHNEIISTGNIMGFVGVGDTQIDIKSRFETGDKDYFLHYILQKVFAINLFKWEHDTTQEQIFDFLLYLFPYYLKKALAQGIFKKYRRFEYNDANIRGPIDVNRHIRQNIPFKGSVAYSAREHTYDNEVTQLVRHTIEYIRTKEQGSTILNIDSDTKEGVNQVVMATQSYNARERQRVINQNLRPVSHPYFSAYTELQTICLQILRHEELKYGTDDSQIYGILFDGAWLWEEYLNTIFEENNLDITHAKNKTGDNGISLFKNGWKCYYPDFYKFVEGDKEGSFVFDAKYKRLGYDINPNEQEFLKSNKISICREDLFQMITYMHVLPAAHCALLYPIEPNEASQTAETIVSDSRELAGSGGEIFGYGIKISAKDNMIDFWSDMENMEKEFSKRIIEFKNSMVKQD